MNNKIKLIPILKWAGGKRQLMPQIRKHMPDEYNDYYEPFVGAGALLLELQPQTAVINDFNEELINVYNVVKNNVDELIDSLKLHKNEEDYFYKIRELDRISEFVQLNNIQKASRFIFLNKTGYNGLYRVNSKGQFNVPFGKYKKPLIVNEEGLRNLHKYLNNNNIIILNTDFEHAVKTATKGDFVYFDPPYDPLTTTSSFTAYSKEGFNRTDQERLYRVYKELDERGCFVMLSNSSTDFIKDLYKEFNVNIVTAKRNINSKGTGRGAIDEVLITNYEQRYQKEKEV